jgi:hypothetical protein
MYMLTLTLHSLMRWVVVIVGLVAVVRFLAGWLGKKEWTSLDTRLLSIFPMTVDIQLLLGLLLYFLLSPISTSALRDFGGAMSNAVLRFYAVEHLFMMILALVVAHVGSMLARKGTVTSARFRLAGLLFLAAMIIIFLAIPWPFVAAGSGRPWLRLG